MVLKIYRGIIKVVDIGESSDVLVLQTKDAYDFDHDNNLAATLERDIEQHGQFLTVKYYISNYELSEEALVTNWLDQLEGIGDAKYHVHYSDYTGYLWTDQEFKVGGHDILAELASYEGKFLHLEIEYNHEQRINTRDTEMENQDTIYDSYRKSLEKYFL